MTTMFETKSKEYIADALTYRSKLLSDGNWVRLYKDINKISLTYGRIFSNGQFESAIGTRTYFMYDGKVDYINTSHL